MVHASTYYALDIYVHHNHTIYGECVMDSAMVCTIHMGSKDKPQNCEDQKCTNRFAFTALWHLKHDQHAERLRMKPYDCCVHSLPHLTRPATDEKEPRMHLYGIETRSHNSLYFNLFGAALVLLAYPHGFVYYNWIRNKEVRIYYSIFYHKTKYSNNYIFVKSWQMAIIIRTCLWCVPFVLCPHRHAEQCGEKV